MEPLKVVLLCSSRLALPALQELAFFKMLGAVVIPRHCDEWMENVKVVLQGLDIPVVEADRDSYVDQIREAIEKYKPAVGIIITFSFKIPASVYTLPPHGFYNVHPAPLPGYRGVDPVFQQIKNKEKRAGITVHKLDEGFDTGDIVMKEMIRLEPTDTYGMLTTKLAHLAARLTAVFLKLISFEIAIPSKPQDNAKATFFKKQTAKDTSINWQFMDADSIIALINACNPWNKGAITKINHKIVRLLEAEKQAEKTGLEKILPGTVISIEENGLIVSTADAKTILVRYIYADEGFIHATRLRQLGVMAGHQFENDLN